MRQLLTCMLSATNKTKLKASMYLNCQSLWNKLWVPQGSAKSSSPLCWRNVYSHPISFVIVAKNRKSSRLSKLSRCLQSIIWHLCRHYDTSWIAWAYLKKKKKEKSVYKGFNMVSKQVSNLTYFPFLLLWKYIYFFKYILHRVFSYIKNLLNNPLLLKCLLLLLYTCNL